MADPPVSKAVNTTSRAPVAEIRPSAAAYFSTRPSMFTRGRMMSLAPA